MGGGDAGGIGARAEERGMAKRGDAAIAGDEIDRQHEKRNGDDAGQKRQIIRKQVITGNRGDNDEERSRSVRAAASAPSGFLPFQSRRS